MPNAPWEDHLNDQEKQRLAALRLRRELKTQTLEEISSEIEKMMNRAIRRMRRAKGKK
jgi:hypothetical protein